MIDRFKKYCVVKPVKWFADEEKASMAILFGFFILRSDFEGGASVARWLHGIPFTSYPAVLT